MRDHPGPVDDPLWAEGDMMFRVAGGAEPDRLVKVRRPYALVGRALDADVVVDDRAASARHAYLHLDPRGVYAVDLVTRTGTRINGAERVVGWLRPGDWIEVAGRKIELLRIRIKGAVISPPPCDVDLLAYTERPGLAGLTLESTRGDELPWELDSELVFLGWSGSCGIQVKDQAVARTHCALVRSPSGAYLVDLCGRQTWVEDRPVAGASALHDGDIVTLGSTQFNVRLTPAAPPSLALLPEVVPRHEAAALLARFQPLADAPAAFPPLPLNTEIVPAEAQNALLAWLAGAIQGGQGEVLRRQGEFHLAVTQVLRQMQMDNATLLNAHLQRIENTERELAAIRSEIQRRNNGPPPPPSVEPLKIARGDRNAEPSPETGASTTWLLDRVNQLEEEKSSAWKDLLGRISQSRKAN